MNVLSIQSHVAYGHVGNSAAVFALQRLGHEVWPVHTVQFSNHPGHGAFRGRPIAAGDIEDVVRGLDELGVLADCDAVLSGYLGDPTTGRAVLGAVARVKAANPDALYLCDPVMGDREGGIYVRDGVSEFMKNEAVSVADIVTPNAFELEVLTGRQAADARSAHEALTRLRDRGPRVAVATGLTDKEGAIQTLAIDDSAELSVETPVVPTTTRPDGAGDLFAALFLAHLLERRDLDNALSRAASGVHAILRASAAAKTRELKIIDAQNELVAPSRVFECRSFSARS